jgi:hypothetical protein
LHIKTIALGKMLAFSSFTDCEMKLRWCFQQEKAKGFGSKGLYDLCIKLVSIGYANQFTKLFTNYTFKITLKKTNKKRVNH